MTGKGEGRAGRWEGRRVEGRGCAKGGGEAFGWGMGGGLYSHGESVRPLAHIHTHATRAWPERLFACAGERLDLGSHSRSFRSALHIATLRKAPWQRLDGRPIWLAVVAPRCGNGADWPGWRRRHYSAGDTIRQTEGGRDRERGIPAWRRTVWVPRV